MTEKQLFEILKQKESTTLEFKSRIDSPYKIARTLAAFANTSGGQLIIGVNDDKSIKGCSEIEEMTKVIYATSELVVPPIDIVYSSVKVEGKHNIMIVNITEAVNKPHESIDEHEHRTVYVRANDETTPVTKEMTQVMIKADKDINKQILEQPNVKYLITYLKKNTKITAKEYAKLVNISAYRATKLLEALTYESILLMLSRQKPTQFVLRKW
ncbi:MULTISPECIES: ATP-binding protein [unclassified Arcicella]|uniref:AlbA family DNA-binding domain-containing protein n=1 Tax=unclassified Arcicella TaxID=2644986 RepID=UPI00285E782C|nr:MULTISPECIES: ATP-binding protein [unclassified Arcicella]MDR6563574.1 putative HTH transcriptional regulator [Arcicella sp. BE51]MDR6813314.1 putative HTH transcriptional regulator [Arcicella sp. BE140]MDR6824628.1 putative HTH transcriptional regulator [Arcicella sp. BE139]